QRDAGLDASAEAAELVIHPLAADHVADGEPAFLREADILDAERLRRREVVLGREGAIETGLPRGRAKELPLAPQERDGPRDIARIAFRNRAVEDEPRAASREEYLMAVVRLAPVFHEHIGVGLEERDEFLVSGHRFVLEHAALGLV